MTVPSPPNPASQGLAADLMGAWEQLLVGFSAAFGTPLPFRFSEILIWRVVLTPNGERIIAPVQMDDVRPETPLYMDTAVLLMDDTVVKTQSTIYVNEQGMPEVTHTEVTEFEITPGDVVNNALQEKVVTRLMEALKKLPDLTVMLLQVRLHAARQGGTGLHPGPAH